MMTLRTLSVFWFRLAVPILLGAAGGYQLFAQSTFNYRYAPSNQLNTIFSAVTPLPPGGYLTVGVAVDTVPYYFSGAVQLNYFGEDGVLEHSVFLRDPEIAFEFWNNSLIMEGDTAVVFAGYRTGVRSFLARHLLYTDSIYYRDFPGPYLPLYEFGVPNGLSRSGGGYLVGQNQTRPGSSFNRSDYNLLFIDNKFELLDSVIIYDPDLSSISGAAVQVATNNNHIVGQLALDRIAKYHPQRKLKLYEITETLDTVRTYTSPPDEYWYYPTSILNTEDGGYLVLVNRTHYRNFLVGQDSTSLAGYFPYLLKFDAELRREWARNLSREVDWFRARNETATVLPAQDGPGYVAAYSADAQYIVPNRTRLMSYLVRVDEAGEILYRRQYYYLDTIETTSQIRDMAATPDGGYILAGQVIAPHDPDTLARRQQGWLLKVDRYGCLVPGCQGTVDATNPEPAAERRELLLYPNPAGAELHFLPRGVGRPSRARLRIIDLQGRTVLTRTDWELLGETTYTLPVGRLPAGTYWLSIEPVDGSRPWRERFLKR